jgi:hypothetical protein
VAIRKHQTPTTCDETVYQNLSNSPEELQHYCIGNWSEKFLALPLVDPPRPLLMNVEMKMLSGCLTGNAAKLQAKGLQSLRLAANSCS